jgi:lipopolysaccharide heptosyltransferase I
VNRILIVRMSALGDIVHALPVLAALGEAFPRAEIDWLAEAAYAGVLELVDGIANRVVVRPGYRNALRFLRQRRYDAAIDLQGLIKSAAAARLSGARRVIGFQARALREPGAAWFYHEAVPVPDAVHVIQKNLSVLPALGVPAGPARFPLRIAPSAVADELSAAAPAGYVLLNPGAAWPNKRWEPARFGEVASRLRDSRALPSFVLWGRGEADLAERVVTASRGAAHRAPATSLADLVAVARGARLMISGDTGPAHLAAAVGTPLVGLYGPTWPERNGPWDPADEVVSRADTCRCHHKRECQVGRVCINEITVDDVYAAAERRLAKGKTW